jgi:hypothetical protein
MTRADVQAARLVVLEILCALGEVADQLTVIDQTLANPSPFARDVDAITIAQAIDGGAGTADALAGSAEHLAKTLDEHLRRRALARRAAVREGGST